VFRGCPQRRSLGSFASFGGGPRTTLLLLSALYVLREKLLDERHGGKRMFHVEQYALIIKAWNAFAKGQEMKRLSWSSQEAFPKVLGLG
jgi:hypothetical protein